MRSRKKAPCLVLSHFQHLHSSMSYIVGWFCCFLTVRPTVKAQPEWCLAVNHAFNGTGLTEGQHWASGQFGLVRLFSASLLLSKALLSQDNLNLLRSAKRKTEIRLIFNMAPPDNFFSKDNHKKQQKNEGGGVNKLLSHSLLCSCEPRCIQRTIVSNWRQEIIYSKANHTVKPPPPTLTG